MDARELRPGLWRWTAPHPEWTPEKDRPGGWGRMVGCLYYEEPSILIDPLAPPSGSPDALRFWSALDADVARGGRPVTVLLGNHFHQRHTQAVLDRYGASPGAVVCAHEAARGHVSCALFRTFDAETTLPGGVKAIPIAGLEDSETAYWLPGPRALVIADAVIGTGTGSGTGTGAGTGTEPGPGTGARVAPVSWALATPEGVRRYHGEFRASLRRLLDLPIELLLVSHGAPILEDGAKALESALESPPWGE